MPIYGASKVARRIHIDHGARDSLSELDLASGEIDLKNPPVSRPPQSPGQLAETLPRVTWASPNPNQGMRMAGACA